MIQDAVRFAVWMFGGLVVGLVLVYLSAWLWRRIETRRIRQIEKKKREYRLRWENKTE